MPESAYDYGDVALADLNADGHTDIVLAVHLRGLLVLVGDGKGKFENYSKGIGFLERGEEEKEIFS